MTLKKEKKLRLSAKERIHEIKSLKEEAKNSKDKLLNHLLDGETKNDKLLTNLEYENSDALLNTIAFKSKSTCTN